MMVDHMISGRAFLGITKDEWKDELKISFGGVLTLYHLQKEIKGNILRRIDSEPEPVIVEWYGHNPPMLQREKSINKKKPLKGGMAMAVLAVAVSLAMRLYVC